MSEPGWYSDPEGRPGYSRYWDGQEWKGEAVQMGAEATPKRLGRWVWPAVGGVVIIVVVALVWGVFGGGIQTVLPGASPTPGASVSRWDEVMSESPSPSPSPSPSETASQGGETVPCPRVPESPAAQGDPSRMSGGGISFPMPDGATSYTRVSRLLTDDHTRAFRYPGSSWASFITVGLAPAKEDFTDPAVAAPQIIECHVTGGNYPGYQSHELKNSEAVTIDGKPGRWVRMHAASSEAPGGGAIFDAVVLDTGNPEGLAVFFGGSVDADEAAIKRLDDIRAAIKVG